MLIRKGEAVPGDKVAVSEEFLPGRNVYDDSGVLRAKTVGELEVDLRSREIHLVPATRPKTLEVGDTITGQVESVQSNIAQIRIYYVNDSRVQNSFVGYLQLKNNFHKDVKESPVKLGDIVRARVISKANSVLHLSIEDLEYGVLLAFCSRCGKKLSYMGSMAKCIECGSREYRKFAKKSSENLVL